MTNLPIEERLFHYFLSMGAQRVEPSPNVPPGLTLDLGSDRVQVAVLKSDAFLQRGKIIESIMNLLSAKEFVNQMYLAAPRLLGTALDVELFRSHGIGLLLFDDRRIDEAVAPQSFHAHQSGAGDQSHDLALVTEIATLKSMYLEMQKTLAKMNEDLKDFRENVGTMPSSPGPIHKLPVLPQEFKLSSSGSELPSFFTNNPWLDVLSKRGREEAPPIAG
jgi:hypothetical protein